MEKIKVHVLLFDTGWHSEMSPDGVYDRQAQIKSLGSWFLYQIDYVLLSHLYSAEAKTAFCGRVWVPDDLERINLA